MSCKICGRYDCTECFHSIEEQENYGAEQQAQDRQAEAEYDRRHSQTYENPDYVDFMRDRYQ